MTVTRAGALVAILLVVPSVLHAETATTLNAASGQAAFTPQPIQSPVTGAKPLSLDIGVGSAIFHDPKDGPNVYYTLSDRGANFTCDEAEDLLGVAPEVICPEADGLKAGSGRVYPTPDYNVSIYQVTLDPATRTFTLTGTIPLKTPKGNAIVRTAAPGTASCTSLCSSTKSFWIDSGSSFDRLSCP